MQSERRAPGEHRDPVSAADLPSGRRPESGPIAIGPEEREPFISAVRAGGGVLEPVSDATRGLVFLLGDSRRPPR